jgi:transcriptional regulator GlxA family with amidase domain
MRAPGGGVGRLECGMTGRSNLAQPKAKAEADGTNQPTLKVGIPLYTGFDSLDVLGPYQTFTFAGMDRYLIAADCDPVESFEGVCLSPRSTFAKCPQLDVLFVPGGSDPVSEVLLKGHPGCNPSRNPYLDFLITQAEKAQLVCSVCTGALLLAGAGLLDGCDATTHWAYKDVLALFPCSVVDDYRRYVQSGNRVTGGGISSGLDVAMYIVSLLYGVHTARKGQLEMQYNPHPPFHCGDPDDTDIKDDPGMVLQVKQDFNVKGAYEAVAKWLGK